MAAVGATQFSRAERMVVSIQDMVCKRQKESFGIEMMAPQFIHSNNTMAKLIRIYLYHFEIVLKTTLLISSVDSCGIHLADTFLNPSELVKMDEKYQVKYV